MSPEIRLTPPLRARRLIAGLVIPYEIIYLKKSENVNKYLNKFKQNKNFYYLLEYYLEGFCDDA
jgi:hypothetical protein